jgi:hypothetical protein
MIKSYPNEEWSQIDLPKGSLKLKYAVSNHGRLASYNEDLIRDGRLLKGGNLGGYPTFVCRPFGKSKTMYTHKLVAEKFLDKKSDDQTYVLHYS